MHYMFELILFFVSWKSLNLTWMIKTVKYFAVAWSQKKGEKLVHLFSAKFFFFPHYCLIDMIKCDVMEGLDMKMYGSPLIITDC